MTDTIDPTFVLANRMEALLWLGISFAMAVTAMRQRRLRFHLVIAAVAFALFGISDLVETTTGAWWRPWWLLAWKLACLFTFVWLLKRYITLRTPGSGSSTSSRRSAGE